MFALTISVVCWASCQVPESPERVSTASFPHSVERTELRRTEGPGGAVLYQYVLKIGESGDAIPLGTMQEMNDERMGFDAESFGMHWLARDEVLHLHWTTVPEGKGRYQAQGNVVLMKLEGAWSDVLRDYRAAYAGFGYRSYGGTTVRFAWNDAERTLRLMETSFGSEHSDTPGPLFQAEPTDNDTVMYFRKASVHREWEGRLLDGVIAFDRGKEYLSAAYERSPFSLNAIALFIEERYKRTNQLAELIALNPGLTAASPCPERVLIAELIPPFEPHPEELWLP